SPRPRAPSFRSLGTCAKRSRLIEDVIGMIMIVRIRTAANIELPTAGWDGQNGVQPKAPFSHGPNWWTMTGRSTRIPHRPSTTLGTAASISTTGPTTARTGRGASSVRNSPIPIEIGAAMITAKSVVYAVPKMKSSAPNWLVTAVHGWGQTNDSLNCEIDGRAPSTTL